MEPSSETPVVAPATKPKLINLLDQIIIRDGMAVVNVDGIGLTVAPTS